jgi:hypothetical protein
VNLADLEPWRRFWYEWVTAAFTKGYLMAAKDALFLPKERQELQGTVGCVHPGKGRV